LHGARASDGAPLVVAGMFGRRPQARIWHIWGTYPIVHTPPTIAFDINFQLMTSGPGVVRDLYVGVRLPANYGGVNLAIEFPDIQNWAGQNAYNQIISLVSKDGFKLAPGTVIAPMKLKFALAPPFNRPLSYEFTYGHAESPVHVVAATLQPGALQEEYEAIVTKVGSNAGTVWPSPFLNLLDPSERYK
jgi:hypothetical protein